MITNVTPIYGQDYAPGFDLFTLPLLDKESFLAEGIIWFQDKTEVANFSDELKKYSKGISHVVGVLDNKTGIEAAEKGIQKCDLSKYLDDPDILCVFREPWQLNSVATGLKNRHMLTLEGNPYDAGTYLGFMFNAFTKFQNLIPRWRKLPMIGHLPGARVCSSLQADGWQHTSYKVFPPMSDYHFTRIHVHMLFNSPMYKPFRFDKER